MSSLADAIIAVTHRCNAHCSMCNVWRGREPDALEPQHLRRLPANLRTINLTGGEPFLRRDLAQFVAEARARCPKAQITISTNAYLGGRIVEAMEELLRIDPALRLAVSLDGVGDAHDAVRGDKGIFDRALGVIRGLLARNYAGLRLSMTISEHNSEQLLPVQSLAQELGLELGVVAAHSSEVHMRAEQPEPPPVSPAVTRQFDQFVRARLLDPRARQWLRAHFAESTYRYLAGCRRPLSCRAGSDFFFLQASGDVYACNIANFPLGNIITQEWPELWDSAQARQSRQCVRRCDRACWMICTARSYYRRNPLRVGMWIAANQLKARLGKSVLHQAAARELCDARSAH